MKQILLSVKEDNQYFPIGRACGALLGAVITVGAGIDFDLKRIQCLDCKPKNCLDFAHQES